MATAINNQLTKDSATLKLAAQKLIDLYATGNLVKGASPYHKGSTYAPKDITGAPEDRTPENGINDLKRLIATM